MLQNSKNNWKKGRVIRGKGLGKTLGYPTINLDNPKIMKGSKEGVYLSRININKTNYFGLLYFGPRLVLGEKKNILEIYVIDFLKEIYGEVIKFKLIKFIRKVMEFANTTELQEQIEKDFAQAKKMLK